ncbi:MAG: amidohydrolase family protein [Candidatus Zixiibacteriota bacterium]
MITFKRPFILALAVVVMAANSTSASTQIPAAPQTRPVALTGATIHPVSGPDIPNGTVVFAEGKIIAIGANVDIPQEAERIDAGGKHIYPGLIDAYSRIGLTEIGSIRATRDYSETGEINPNVRAEVAVNPESEVIPVTRSNGVLMALAAPGGSVLSGMSALLVLDGWTWEDMTLKAPVAMHLEWPRMTTVTAWWQRQTEEEQIKRRDDNLKEISDAFAEARRYLTAMRAAPSDHQPDSRWEAMIPVLEGKLPIIVSANEVQQIQAAVAFAERENVRIIIYGGYDAPYCADLLTRRGIPVMTQETHSTPSRRWEAYDDPFTLADRLRKAGIQFCITGGGGASNARNLPYFAATAAAYGLPHDEALKSITLYPAQILGVADRVGSIESGKDATLIVTNGDILEIPTQVEMAFIQGRQVDLSDKQKLLWMKYREKYRRLGLSD